LKRSPPSLPGPLARHPLRHRPPQLPDRLGLGPRIGEQGQGGGLAGQPPVGDAGHRQRRRGHCGERCERCEPLAERRERQPSSRSPIEGLADAPLAAAARPRLRLFHAHGEHRVVAEAGQLVDRAAALLPDLDPRDRGQVERQRREQLGSDEQLLFVHPPPPHPPAELRHRHLVRRRRQLERGVEGVGERQAAQVAQEDFAAGGERGDRLLEHPR
jgi:hypothetical protein